MLCYDQVFPARMAPTLLVQNMVATVASLPLCKWFQAATFIIARDFCCLRLAGHYLWRPQPWILQKWVQSVNNQEGRLMSHYIMSRHAATLNPTLVLVR